MRDFYLLLNSIVAIALIILSVAAFLSDKKARMNRVFLLFSSSVALWLVSASVSNDVRLSPDVAIYAKYLVFLCSYFASFFILRFAVIIVGSRDKGKKLRYVSILLVLIGLLSATPLVVADIMVQNEVYAVEFGPLVLLYALGLIGQLIAAVVILRNGKRHTKGKKKKQIESIYRALIIAIPILLATQFIIPITTGLFGVTDVGILAMVLPVVALYTNVIRHGLFDLRLAVVRTVAYGLSLAVLVGVYLIVAYTVLYRWVGGAMTGQHIVLNMVLTLLVAFLFQPVKQFFDRLTNKLFYKEMYNSEEFYAKLNHVIHSASSLRTLLEKSVELISVTFKSESTAFFIYRDAHPLFTTGSKGYNKMPMSDVREFDALRKPVHIDDTGLSNHLRRIMVSHRISLVVPLYLNDRAVGLMCLGDHKASNYTRRDLRVLRVSAGEIVVGVQNMLAIQEIRDLNDHLQQRIDDATSELRRSNAQLRKLDEVKDEFVSMASHQLRTPLTSIKGYIDMILEGDAGKITAQQRAFLTEAFASSERMVHLINDFLSVSRLQTGKFILEKRPVDLSAIVSQELESLAISAEQRQLSFSYHPAKNIPPLALDEAKIRQVIMNFVDNALYYSKPDSTIRVKLKVIDTVSVEFTVKDTGIGVPKSEQSELFTKFFRASNARYQRPDGTGIGLYLAKRVVMEHGGHIIFSSVEGEGSTFGFSLPIKQLQLRDDADKLNKQHNNNHHNNKSDE